MSPAEEPVGPWTDVVDVAICAGESLVSTRQVGPVEVFAAS